MREFVLSPDDLIYCEECGTFVELYRSDVRCHEEHPWRCVSDEELKNHIKNWKRYSVCWAEHHGFIVEASTEEDAGECALYVLRDGDPGDTCVDGGELRIEEEDVSGRRGG